MVRISYDYGIFWIMFTGNKTAAMEQNWKPITGTDGKYEVSDLGNVKAYHPQLGEIILKPMNSNGYLVVIISKNGIRKQYKVHRLVGVEWIPNPGNKPEINHKNGIKCDNRAENLEWATGEENNDHALRTGLNPSGENHRNSKLKTEEVVAILSSKFGYGTLAKQYNVNRTLIRAIKKGWQWKHITVPYLASRTGK